MAQLGFLDGEAVAVLLVCSWKCLQPRLDLGLFTAWQRQGGVGALFLEQILG